MITTISFCIGLLMFIHYGCSVLKHDATKSTLIVKLSLIILMICAVLIMLNSYIKDVEVLLMSYAVAVLTQTLLQIYLWFYGLSIKKASSLIYDMHLPIKDYLKRFKRSL